MKTYKNFEDVIDMWPMQKDLAADMNLPPVTIGKWYERNSIRGCYFKRIAEFAKKRRFPGITEKLLSLFAEEREVEALKEAAARKAEKTG